VTTPTPAEQLAEGGADVRWLSDQFDLIGELRKANQDQPGQAWTFVLDSTDRRAPTLTVGLNGTMGFITWWDGRLRMHPQATQTTGEMVDYWRGGHHFQIDAGTEVPAEYVFAAVAEFVATHVRPHCIQWPTQAA